MTREEKISQILDSIYAPATIVYELGGYGQEVRIYSDLEDKASLFDFSYSVDAENEPTYLYLKEHAEDVFASRDPEMRIRRVLFYSPDGIADIGIQLELDISERLRVLETEDILYLNSSLEDPKFGVSLHPDNKSKPSYYLVGYTQNEEQSPYVIFYHEVGPATTITFTMIE